ncbi:MAG TPA: amidohydrolase family protein [Streptosporangiaceae bacterium]|nr:amidohydrolase family protein [Streptosporangiaceae bacterium]
MIIDAHHHIWDPAGRAHPWLDSLPPLRRRFALSDYALAAGPPGVTASILVQVLADVTETEEFLALAAASQDSGGLPVAGVVGWVDLTGPDVGSQIARLRGLPGGDRLAGIRHLVQDEPDPGWLDRPDVRRGLRAVGAAGLVYDLLVRPPQLPAALRVTADLDAVSFVLDHGAKPPIAAGQVQPWARQVAGLAARPNVTCKVSGLVTEAGPGWRPEQIAPYVEVLMQAFGPGRLLFGSDWPVCTLAATCAEVVELARSLLSAQFSPAELHGVLAANAVRVYRLPSAAARA